MTTTHHTSSKPRTVKEIQNLFAATLRNLLGIEVEITVRDRDQWTISGDADAVRVAVRYVEAHALLKLEREIEHDDELDESFAYMIGGAS